MTDRKNEKMENLTLDDLENVAGGVVILAEANGKYELHDLQGKALGAAATKEEARALAQKLWLPLHANMESAKEALARAVQTKSPMSPGLQNSRPKLNP